MKKIKARKTQMFPGKPTNVHRAGPAPSPAAQPEASNAVAASINAMTEDEQQAANVYFSTMQEMARRLSMQIFGRHGREVDALKIVDGVTSDINEMIIKKLPKTTVPEMAALFSGAVGAAVGIAVGMDKTGKLRENLTVDMFDSMGAMFAMGVRLTAESIIERQGNKVQLITPSGIH